MISSQTRKRLTVAAAALTATSTDSAREGIVKTFTRLISAELKARSKGQQSAHGAKVLPATPAKK